MVWFMYQTLNAVFHSFLNRFQRDSGCSYENFRQANKQKCFLWVLQSNNAGFPQASHPTCSASSSLRPEQRQHSPSRAFSILPAVPSHSLPCPQEAQQSCWPQAGLANWLWPPCRDLPVPSVEPPASLAHPTSTVSFPSFPSQPLTGSSTQGQGCIFRPTPRTWISILFCSQIYREGFDSSILLSLQEQNCVCQQ